VLYHLLYPLHEIEGLSFLNIFRYITFRSAYAAVTSLAVCFLFGPAVVAWLRRFQIVQTIRRDGPETHLAKEGTPTMGGVLIVAAIVIPTFLWADLTNRYVQLSLLVTLWLGGLGFLDDYLHIIRRAPKGLLGRYKLAAQVLLGLVVGLVLVLDPLEPAMTRQTNVPFLKDVMLNLGPFFVPFVILVLTGSSNAVNLTDGLDGLAIGSSLIASGTYAILAYVAGHAKVAGYLDVPNVRGVGELAVICGALVGASLGFLWFNCNPAQVFMGDVGAMAIGGGLGTIAIAIKQEVLLVFVGGLFVVEAVSVILQVGSFKLRGKRIFRMAPIHHHFELGGWPEQKVVIRFWIVALIFALMGLSTLKLR
jgi:phospho-N-acetylmuramoyl-pentapeptide-transferase